jgi:hypothetical protein
MVRFDGSVGSAVAGICVYPAPAYVNQIIKNAFAVIRDVIGQ